MQNKLLSTLILSLFTINSMYGKITAGIKSIKNKTNQELRLVIGRNTTIIPANSITFASIEGKARNYPLKEISKVSFPQKYIFTIPFIDNQGTALIETNDSKNQLAVSVSIVGSTFIFEIDRDFEQVGFWSQKIYDGWKWDSEFFLNLTIIENEEGSIAPEFEDLDVDASSRRIISPKKKNNANE